MTSRPATREEWALLLAQRIDESGLSARRFAREVLRRDERTIRRWIALDSPIPAEVQDFLVDPTPAPWP
jgi:hypothetical protein